MLAGMTTSVSTPRYRCGYPGCIKRYASTDGVRKHARKTHTQWLRDVDEQSALRDHKLYGNKPSTYCVMEAATPSSTIADCASSSEEGERQPLRSCQIPYQNNYCAALPAAAFLDPSQLPPLSPGSLLPCIGDLGCKRPLGVLDMLENTHAAKRPTFDMLWDKPTCNGLPKAFTCHKVTEPFLEALSPVDRDEDSDTSSNNGAGDRLSAADSCLTPLTVPLPRPMTGNGSLCPSPLELSEEPLPVCSKEPVKVSDFDRVDDDDEIGSIFSTEFTKHLSKEILEDAALVGNADAEEFLQKLFTAC